jgi:hypothetical protein
MTPTNDPRLSPEKLDEIVAQFLSGPNRCETTSEIPTLSSSPAALSDAYDVPLKRVGPSISRSDTVNCGHIEVQRSEDG